MRIIEEIINEIKRLKKIKNDTDLANLLGVKPNTICTWKTRKNIPYDVIYRFCENYGYDMIDIVSGKQKKKLEGTLGETASSSDPKLSHILNQARHIYIEGNLSQKGALRGIIEEIYDEMKKEGEKEWPKPADVEADADPTVKKKLAAG